MNGNKCSRGQRYVDSMKRVKEKLVSELSKLSRRIVPTLTCESGPGRVLEMLFSDTLYLLALLVDAREEGTRKRRRHRGRVADNVRPSSLIWLDPRSIFFESLLRALHVLNAAPLVANVRVEFCDADARAIPFWDGSADLVLTSPPNNVMIDYSGANCGRSCPILDLLSKLRVEVRR